VTLSRAWLYGLVVPVVLFETAVAVLAFLPQVPDRFRAFFIDRTTDCWPIDVSGEYALGETVSYLPPKSAAQTGTMRCGWLGPQDTGTWSSGPESRLRFAVADPPADLVLDLELIPFVTDVQPVQTIRISVNGKGIDTIQLEGSEARHQMFSIPGEIVALGDERIDVDFQFPSAHSPARAGINADRRLLALRLLSARVIRAE
jgi:hypothetical protein